MGLKRWLSLGVRVHEMFADVSANQLWKCLL